MSSNFLFRFCYVAVSLFGIGMLSSCTESTTITTFVHDTVMCPHQWFPAQTSTSSDLVSVFFTDIKTGTAVGGNGTIMRTTNGGRTWTNQSSGVFRTLYACYFVDVNTGMAVGDNDEVACIERSKY